MLANFNADDHRTSEFWHDSPGPENLGLGSTVFLSFDLENEVPYQKAVDKLVLFAVVLFHINGEFILSLYYLSNYLFDNGHLAG